MNSSLVTVRTVNDPHGELTEYPESKESSTYSPNFIYERFRGRA